VYECDSCHALTLAQRKGSRTGFVWLQKKTVDWGLHNYKECPTKKSKHGRRVEGRAALIHTYLGQTIQIHYAAVEQL